MARKGQDSSKYEVSNQPLEADAEDAYLAPVNDVPNQQECEVERIRRPDPCEPDPCITLVADADVCGGSLYVSVRSACEITEGDSHAYSYEDDDGEHYLSGVEVCIRKDGFVDTCLTDEDGGVSWDNLPVGPYEVIAYAPDGYRLAANADGDSSAAAVPGSGGTGAAPAIDYDSKADARLSYSQPVTITESKEIRIECRFVPRPAYLHVHAYNDAQRSGQRAGQQPINRVMCEVYKGSTLVGCYRTGENESGIYLPCPGQYSVVMAPTIKVQCRTFKIARNRRIEFNAQPDDVICVDFGYVAETSAVRVSSCVEWEHCGEPRRNYLNGVTFRLYQGMTARGDCLSEYTTNGPVPITFHDLSAGTYTVAIAGSNRRYFKGQRIELYEPCDGDWTFKLTGCESQPLSKEFCFRPCGGRISGRIMHEQCCEPVANAPVMIFDAEGRGKPVTVYSDANGHWEVADVKPGEYIVVAQQFTLDGQKLVPSKTSFNERTVIVPASGIVEVEDITMAEDIHRIFGVVRDGGGNPLPSVTVEIRDANRLLIATRVTQTNPPGFYEYIAEEAGEYFVSLLENAVGEPVQSLRVSLHSDVEANLQSHALINPGQSGPSFRSSSRSSEPIQALSEPISDLASFPVLTEEISFPSSPRPSWPSGSGSAPVGAMVESALQQVLGWKVRTDDAKGFVGALTQAFTCTEVEGHTECKWMPRSNAVQTDLAGGVTGAQASVYKRAQDAVDQSMPILDGLYPLRSDADPQDMDALRSVVKNQMTEIVRELGIPGGPRVTRVDQLFALLLGQAITPDPDNVAGQLGILRREFGLRSQPNPPIEQGNLINNIEEEQNLTNFRILSDYMTSLRQSWLNNRNFFTRPTANPFYGTQLVLLSRTLNVVAESVEEVRFTMDSVMIGPAERQTLEIRFHNSVALPGRPQPQPPGVPLIDDGAVPTNPMFVEELLTWVGNFATEEGPRLIQDGGKFAVSNTFLPVVCQLRNLVFDAVQPANVLSLPRGYRTQRVQRALLELALQLDELASLANPIQHQIPSQT